MRPLLDFERINSAPYAVLRMSLSRWLPGGRRVGPEWIAFNPKRADRHYGSFCINVVTSRWADFATADAGGDPISLAAFLFDLRQAEAVCCIADILGISGDQHG
jgi:hypothetical protein